MCKGMKWHSDHSLKNKLEAAGLSEKRCGTARVLVYNFPTELKPWPVKLKETSAKDTEEDEQAAPETTSTETRAASSS